ncbi:MAG: hypothetical protein IKV65_04345 [Erysipelotrichaceae bacterium]|nr:hypothetical protein [Erysipelotrichaceae bacterium]
MTTMKIKNNTIEITKTFAQKASRVGSPEYYELLKVRQENPSCTVEVKQTKSKDSFKGLTYEYMKKYILAHDDEEGSIMAIFHEMRGTIVEGDDELQAESLTYGEIKMWFLDTYPEIKNFHDSRADRIKAIKEKQKKAAEAKAKAKKVA